MAQIFQLLLAGGVGGGRGEKVLCFYEDWLSHSVSLYGGTRGQGEYRSSVAVFSSNQKPSFPWQSNLEKKCPTWWQWGSSPFWEQPGADPGNGSDWRPVGAPLKPEKNRINDRVHTHERERVYTLWPQWPLALNSSDTCTHACVKVRIKYHPIAFPRTGHNWWVQWHQVWR